MTLKGNVMAEPAPPMLVVHLWWEEGGTSRQETYGPWVVADDDSHLGEITAFLKNWHAVTGFQPAVATMAMLVDPRTFPAPLQGTRDWTPEQVAEFKARWDEANSSRPPQ